MDTPTPWPDLTVSRILDLYQERLVREGRASARVFPSSVKHLREAIGDRHPAAVSTEDLTRLQARRLEAGASGKTINNELSWLRTAYRYAYRTTRYHHGAGKALRLVSWDEIPDVPLLRRNLQQVPEVILPEDFGRLYEQLPPYLRDLAEWSYITGWRRSSSLGLRWQHIHVDRRVVSVPTSKNADPLCRPLTPTVLALLDRRWHAFLGATGRRPGPEDPVFHRDGQLIRSFRSAWLSACERAGLGRLKFHSLRRSFARLAYNSTRSLEDVAALGGWRDRRMVSHYNIRVEDDLRTAAEATEHALLSRLRPAGEERSDVDVG